MDWPWQYSFPPFFTLQPHRDTRTKQLEAWRHLVLNYCQVHSITSLDLSSAPELPLFHNPAISRRLSVESIQQVLEDLAAQGNFEWSDKSKRRGLVYWRSPQQLGQEVYQWVSQTGQLGTVMTLVELLEEGEKNSWQGVSQEVAWALHTVIMNLAKFSEIFDKKKTFRPKKKFQPGTMKYSLHKQAQASLNSGINLRQVVKLPKGEDFNDWLAVHVVDFFNRINLIYGTVCEQCTRESCPTMSGGSKFEYLWQDGVKYKKPVKLPAPQYISLLMDWVESQINDESLFPVTTDIPFPKTFQPQCKKILTRLYRVFVHVYVHHFDRVMSIGAEPHVNTCYKHFYYFVTEFDLINEKEFAPLQDMTRKICTDIIAPPTPTEPHKALFPPDSGGASGHK